jgi:hypothetical protein
MLQAEQEGEPCRVGFTDEFFHVLDCLSPQWGSPAVPCTASAELCQNRVIVD